MANIKRVTINRTAIAQHESDLEPTYELELDEYEITMLRAALRAYRHKLIGELADLIEEDANESNPDISSTREWIDRVAQFKSDIGDR